MYIETTPAERIQIVLEKQKKKYIGRGHDVFSDIKSYNSFLYDKLDNLEKIAIQEGVSGSGILNEWPVLFSALKKMGFSYEYDTAYYPKIKKTCILINNILKSTDRNSFFGNTDKHLNAKKVAIIKSEYWVATLNEDVYKKEHIIPFIYYEDLEEYQRVFLGEEIPNEFSFNVLVHNYFDILLV